MDHFYGVSGSGYASIGGGDEVDVWDETAAGDTELDEGIGDVAGGEEAGHVNMSLEIPRK